MLRNTDSAHFCSHMGGRRVPSAATTTGDEDGDDDDDDDDDDKLYRRTGQGVQAVTQRAPPHRDLVLANITSQRASEPATASQSLSVSQSANQHINLSQPASQPATSQSRTLLLVVCCPLLPVSASAFLIAALARLAWGKFLSLALLVAFEREKRPRLRACCVHALY